MNVGLIFFLGLALLILGVACFVILARSTFAAIVGFVAYGLLLALGWMTLSAPDVALTEAALGGGVTGALLLGAYARLRRSNEVGKACSLMTRGLALVLSAGVTAVLIGVVCWLPEPAPTLAPAARESLPLTGLGNAVTAVLMVYRALDTMLEKVVLLLALVAVWSVAPDSAWGGRPVFGSMRQEAGPLDFLARVLIPVGIIVGVYLFWVGADDPGSAFAGGAIIAAMGILAFFSGLCAVPSVRGFLLRAALAIGVAVFLVVGLTGLATGSGFLTYPEGFEKPVIVLIEIAMTLSIGVTLALLVAGPPGEARPS